MRALLQRVTEASVTVDGDVIGKAENGLLVLVCAMDGDPDDAPFRLASKVSKLRIFRDEDGRMNRSLLDVGGSALVVSQFTLAADTRRGNRPGFSTAMAPESGEKAYLSFCVALAGLGIHVETGRFGAEMQVRLVNDGPVTIWLDSES